MLNAYFLLRISALPYSPEMKRGEYRLAIMANYCLVITNLLVIVFYCTYNFFVVQVLVVQSLLR